MTKDNNLTNIDAIYLTSEDIEELKEVGRGTDAIVYKPKGKENKDIAYKIYHKENLTENKVTPVVGADYKVVLDDDGVNIADNREYFRKRKPESRYKIEWLDTEGVRIYGIDAILKAINRQKNIKLTKLQKKPIYVDGRFRGTVIHYHRNHWAIHNIGLFPLRTKLRVLKELLTQVKELLDNNIYHLDLSLKPETGYKDANVMLSIGFRPHPAIIDIDGKSAVYTESFVKSYYEKTLISYKELLVGILFEIEGEKLETRDDIAYYVHEIKNELAKVGLIKDKEYIENLINAGHAMEIEELQQFLDEYDEAKKANGKR